MNESGEEPEIEMLYLHGWLQQSPFYLQSHQKSLESLKRVSLACRARIFVPQSTQVCRRSVGQVLCWNRANEGENGDVWKTLQNKMPSCLKAKRSESIIALGFSDGAYFLNRTSESPLKWKSLLVSGISSRARAPAIKIPQDLGHWLSDTALIEELRRQGLCLQN